MVEHVLFSVKEQPVQTETLLSNRLATAIHTMSIHFFFYLNVMYYACCAIQIVAGSKIATSGLYTP
jgi:hypothetical protein